MNIEIAKAVKWVIIVGAILAALFLVYMFAPPDVRDRIDRKIDKGIEKIPGR